MARVMLAGSLKLLAHPPRTEYSGLPDGILTYSGYLQPLSQRHSNQARADFALLKHGDKASRSQQSGVDCIQAHRQPALRCYPTQSHRVVSEQRVLVEGRGEVRIAKCGLKSRSRRRVRMRRWSHSRESSQEIISNQRAEQRDSLPCTQAGPVS